MSGAFNCDLISILIALFFLQKQICRIFIRKLQCTKYVKSVNYYATILMFEITLKSRLHVRLHVLASQQ